MLSLSTIKNEYDYLVALYGESRDFTQYLYKNFIQVYDDDCNLLGYMRTQDVFTTGE